MKNLWPLFLFVFVGCAPLSKSCIVKWRTPDVGISNQGKQVRILGNPIMQCKAFPRKVHGYFMGRGLQDDIFIYDVDYNMMRDLVGYDCFKLKNPSDVYCIECIERTSVVKGYFVRVDEAGNVVLDEFGKDFKILHEPICIFGETE